MVALYNPFPHHAALPLPRYYWMIDTAVAKGGACVENAGTCPFQPAMAPQTSQAPEYILATAALVLSVVAMAAMVFALLMRVKAFKASGKKDKDFGAVMSTKRKKAKKAKK